MRTTFPPLLALVLGLACGETAPPSPSPSEPPPVAPTVAPPPPAPSAPAAPAEAPPRLRIGSGHFFSPAAPRAIVAYQDRVYVARDGERVEVWTRDGVLERAFELALPATAPSTVGIGGTASGVGRVEAMDVVGDRIAVALGAGGARVIARDDGHEIFAVRDLDIVHDVALLAGGALATAHGGEAYANGHHIVDARGECGLCVWSSTGERTAAIAPSAAGGWVTAIAATPDGATIVTGASDGRLRVYDANAAAPRELRVGDRRIERIALVDAARVVLYANDVGDVARVGIDGSARARLFTGDEVTQAVALSAERIAWASGVGTVRILDGAGARAASLYLDGPSALAIDAGDVLVGDHRGHVRRWHDGAFASPEDPLRGIGDVFYDETGERLVARAGTELRVHRASDGALESGPRTLPDFTAASALLAGARLVVQRNAISLSEEDLADGAHPRSAGSGSGSSINHVAVSGDRRVLAYATYDRVHVGTTSLREEDGARAIALSDDGAAVAIATQGTTPRLYVAESSTGAERWSATLAHVGGVLAWRADTLAVALAEGGGVELRSATDGSVRATVPVEPGDGEPATPTIAALSLSPDARILVIALDDGRLLFIDAETGAVRRSVHAHRGPVTTLAFRPDGSEIASASTDGTIGVWRLGTE